MEMSYKPENSIKINSNKNKSKLFERLYFLFLVKFFLKIGIFSIKRLYLLKNRIHVFLSLAARRLSDAPQQGINESTDESIHLAVVKFTRPEYFDNANLVFIKSNIDEFSLAQDLQNRFEKCSSQVEAIGVILNNDVACNKARNDFLLTELEISNKLGRIDKYNYLKNMVLADNLEKYSKLQTVEESIKHYKVLISKELSIIRDKNSFKLDINIDSITKISAFCYILMIIGAYQYINIYYSKFGLSVHNYFSISDYISNSINSIGAAFYSSLACIVGFIVGINSASRTTHSLYNQTKIFYIFYKLFIIFL